MFAGLSSSEQRSRRITPNVSAVLHCVLLLWLVHSPRPIFVAPSSVARGDGGSRVTRLYWPGRVRDSGLGDPELARAVPLDRKTALTHPDWVRPPKPGKGRTVPPSQIARTANINPADAGPSAGSKYGSLAEGPLAGEEIRPALPIRASDPAVYPWELREEGDVIVEITIDEAGNITEKRILHSMGASIDQKVLLALETWRFHPATRDGIPIPSKQDVHYHFKPS